MDGDEDRPRRRPRKSRGKGLRTTTGCLTCRKRHKKCDEQQPVCGPCTVSCRPCVFPPAGGQVPADTRAQSRGSTSHSQHTSHASQASHSPSFRDETQNGHLETLDPGLDSRRDADLDSNLDPALEQLEPPLGPPLDSTVSAGSPMGLYAQASQVSQVGHIARVESTQHQQPQQSHQVHQAQHPPVVSPPPQQDVLLRGCWSPEDTTGASTSSEFWTVDFASTRWLDLLANDVAQAGALTGEATSNSHPHHPHHPHHHHHHQQQQQQPRPPRLSFSTYVSPALLNGQARLPANADPAVERRTWQANADLVLTDREAGLLRHFAERCALWLDLFDPRRLFSTYAIRLALRNAGLMKAILALSAKHRAREGGQGGAGRQTGRLTGRQTSRQAGREGVDAAQHGHQGGVDVRNSPDDTSSTSASTCTTAATAASATATTTASTSTNTTTPSSSSPPPPPSSSSSPPQEWIRYYYETLLYVRETLAYPSYDHSEELLATAIVISAYEMLDESDGSGNWQRHLKGVFWIQRSQDVDGSCGGLRQAVWWAWLRQDLWAAFREGRPCFSFWRPVEDVAELDAHGLADRAIYLLSQAVNYSAGSHDGGGQSPGSQMRKAQTATHGPGSSPDIQALIQARRRARDDLVAAVDRWKAALGPEFQTLPTPTPPRPAARPGDAAPAAAVFTPLWVHPPQFGVALQAYHFARILVTLHDPYPGVGGGGGGGGADTRVSGGEASAPGSGGFGFAHYRKVQRTLARSVDVIAGIAAALTDEGSQILSTQCLYGAGLCVDDAAKREAIVGLIEAAQARVGWGPMATWIEDLRREWAQADAWV